MPESTDPAVTPPAPRRPKRGDMAFAVEIKVETGARAEALEQQQAAVLFEIARYFAAQQARDTVRRKPDAAEESGR